MAVAGRRIFLFALGGETSREAGEPGRAFPHIRSASCKLRLGFPCLDFPSRGIRSLQGLLDGESLEGRERLCLKCARRSRPVCSRFGQIHRGITQGGFVKGLCPAAPELRSRPSRPSWSGPSRWLSKAVALHTDGLPPMPTGAPCSGLPLPNLS